MRSFVCSTFVFCVLSLASLPSFADYSSNPEALKMMDALVQKEHFDKKDLLRTFKQANKQQAVLDAMSKPAEKVLQWKQYRSIFITKSRIQQGVQFWQQHQATFDTIEKNYGVPASIIIAIIGVETKYGRHLGNFRVLDALSTLGFDYPPRAAFFRGELKQFLLLCQQHHIDPTQPMGSYAGAMGYGQFIPSSFRAYAVDHSGDGRNDWNNANDAIASIANYLKHNHWHTGEPIIVPSEVTGAQFQKGVRQQLSKPKQTLDQLIHLGWKPKHSTVTQKPVRGLALLSEDGTEYWISFHNFYVITRYNRSDLYAMAVTQLADAIAQEKNSQNVGS